MMAEKKVTLLCQSNHGYVKQCQCCHKIGIGFKNIYIPLKNSDFLTFKDYLGDLSQSHFDAGTAIESAWINLAFADVVVRLGSEEFQQLYQLVMRAEIELFRLKLEASYQARSASLTPGLEN